MDHPVGSPSPANRCVLLDTTIQIDRIKSPGRRDQIASVLAPFDWKITTSFSLLEFKATIIEQCIHIHNELRRSRSRFTRVRDKVLEKNHPQAKLRAHIFNNLISVFPTGSAFDITETQDAVLAEKARLALENVIPEQWRWFVHDSVDVIIRDRLCCTRAEEAPQKRQVAFDTNLPRCQRGRNKTCHVEKVIREEGPRLMERLRRLPAPSPQLEKALALIESVIASPNADISWEKCRGAGDVLIILEGVRSAKHSVSTNAAEWRPLSEIYELEFVHLTYPNE